MKILKKVQTGKKYKKKNQCIRMALFWINQPASNQKLKNSNLFDTLFIYLQLKGLFLTNLNINVVKAFFIILLTSRT